VALLGIVAVALALRLIGLRWGLPNSAHYFSYHPDEIFLLTPSFGFAAGDWNPHFFNYGTLYIYLVGLPAVALGLVPESSQFPMGLAPLYLLARLVTAALGTATVLVLYAAIRSEGHRFALLGAGLLSVTALHVVTSHYATVDVPATFLIGVAFLAALRSAPRPRFRPAVLGGVCVGLAAATKYNVGLFIIPVALAPLVCQRVRPPAAWWPGIAIGALTGFVIGNPYVGSSEFARGFLFELRHAQVGGTLAFVDTGSGWVYHLARGIPISLGYPMTIAAIIGIVFALRGRSPSGRLSVVWIAVYLIAIGFGKERFIRYLVPLTPFLAILAALGLIGLTGQFRRAWPRVFARAAAGVVVLLTALYAFGQTAPFVRTDPRDGAWLSLQPTLDEMRVGLAQAPWYYHPPVSPFNAGAFSQGLFEKWNQSVGERVAVTGWDAELLEASPPYAFCLSDLEVNDMIRLGEPAAIQMLNMLQQTYQGQAVWGRPPEFFSWLAPSREWAPPDWLYLSPRITVYYDPKQ